MGIVNFFWVDVKPSLKNRKMLKGFINKLFKKEKRALQSINYVFCSDEYMLEINNNFLKHDFYTDTITFDLSENKDMVTGEVYISYDRVRDNAKVLKISFNEELHRFIFHGALHLCGYKDKKGTDKTKMREAENNHLLTYFA